MSLNICLTSRRTLSLFSPTYNNIIQLFECWVNMHAFLSSADFFKINFFKINFFKNTIRVSNSLDSDQADVILGLIWVQTVCKGSQQTTLVGKELTHPFFRRQKYYKILGPADQILEFMAIAGSKVCAFVQSIQNLHC